MLAILVNLASCLGPVPSQVIRYEGNVFPEQEGWELILAGTPGAERSLVDGWLVQSVGMPEGWPEPHGDAEFYRRALGGFAGVDSFFVEWRVWTDNPEWLLNLSAVPSAVSAGGNAAVYHTAMTEERIQLFRRTSIPLVYIPIEPVVPHVYRIELRGADSFVWFIDGRPVEGGVPLFAYPDSTASLIWGTRRSYVDSVTAWDYIRYGVIPADASGDYNGDGAITLDDFYIFHECLSSNRIGLDGGPASDAGPGCRFADYDYDADVDLLDLAEFQRAFTSGD